MNYKPYKFTEPTRLEPVKVEEVKPTKVVKAPEIVNISADAHVKLQWSGVKDVAFYRVKRDDGNGYKVVADKLKTNVFVDEKTESGKSYKYTVVAVDEGVESAPSNEKSAKVP